MAIAIPATEQPETNSVALRKVAIICTCSKSDSGPQNIMTELQIKVPTAMNGYG